MASKRDQLQAHQFLAQRMVSALVTRESDPEQPPFRRPGGAAIGSIALAALALVAVGVYGLINPGGNKAWQKGDSVIVVAETGTRYVYLDGHLHPVFNYASALLAIGKNAKTVTVSRNSLTDVPRGPIIGIPDAPDALPDPDRIRPGGWSLCSQPDTDSTGATVDRSVMLAGDDPSGGTAVAEQAVLVDVPQSGDTYLIWHGYRHRIADRDPVTVGLGLRGEPRFRVGMSFVDVIPSGVDIGPIAVPDNGKPSTAVPRRQDIKAGQLLVAETSGGQVAHYLAYTDRLRPISELQYDIQLAYDPTSLAYGGAEPAGIRLGLAATADARQDPTTATAADPPLQRPAFAGTGGDTAAACVTYDSGVAVPRLRVDPQLPATDRMSSTPQRTKAGTPLADRVYVQPGSASLVEVMPSADAPAGTLALVTDQGRAFPLANAGVLDILGYGGLTPVKLPSGLVARVPQGSGLDPKTALGA